MLSIIFYIPLHQIQHLDAVALRKDKPERAIASGFFCPYSSETLFLKLRRIYIEHYFFYFSNPVCR